MRNYLIGYSESLSFYKKIRFPCAKAQYPPDILARYSRNIQTRSASLRQLLLVTSLFPRAYFLTRGSPGLFNPINAHTTLICAVSNPTVCVCASPFLARSLRPPPLARISRLRRPRVARVAALVIRSVPVNCRIHAGSAGRVAHEQPTSE